MSRGVGFLAIAGGLGLLVLGASRRALGAPPPPTSGWVLGNAPPAPSPSSPAPLTPLPRATPKTVRLEGLNRYELVADVLPVEGVSRSDFAEKALDFFGLTKPVFKGARDANHDGWEVTRVTVQANAVASRVLELDRFYQIAGAGTAWVVSVRRLDKF